VGQNAAYRKGSYFWQPLPVTNTEGAVYQTVTTLAALPNGTSAEFGTTNIGHVFVPQTPENYSYDADGNLLSDGRWTYTWDAENRLIGMTSLSGAPAASMYQLAFAYDYQGRRIQKTVSTWSGSGYVQEYSDNYVYDGWNLAAVLSTSASNSASFMWGTDLSGTAQGVGGVGGLLAENIVNSGVQFAAYDANGNVTALVNASTGAVSAQYEYGPFGELIRATGPMAKLNPLRFSTKYQDDETGLLYYGYRYYNPSTGRWVNRDPLGDLAFVQQVLQSMRSKASQTANPYAFVDNASLYNVDQLGLKCKVIACLGAVLATSLAVDAAIVACALTATGQLEDAPACRTAWALVVSLATAEYDACQDCIGCGKPMSGPPPVFPWRNMPVP
jgi:RHS repeat-associated protein